MPKQPPEDKTLERVLQLQEKRRQIMELPPEKALDRILKDRQPAALVHSFPEQDFYVLVNEIGPQDALPLLSLATNKQWGHIVDLETWQKDRIDINSVTRWMNLLMEADSQRFISWLLKDHLEFMEFYLFNNLEVRIREHDQDPTEFGNEFFTLDDVYYLKFIDIPTESESEKLIDEQRRKFITQIAQRLASTDHHIYQSILLEAAHVIPSETEEDCYRWRSTRLAQKGFLPFDEAVGVYQPIKPGELEGKRKKFIPPASQQVSTLPVPVSPLRELKQDNYFTRALQKIEAANIVQLLQTEFAHLCNQVVVADSRIIGERDALQEVVKKTSGYISIGLEQILKDQKDDAAKGAALICEYMLQDIFRIGFGAALKLKWRAEKWLAKCWFAQEDLRLTFWGEQWMGVVGGLLVKKPLYYDNYQSGVLYREFATVEDILESAAIFDQVVAVDDLLSMMNIRMDSPAQYGFLTYKNLLLTLWARHYRKLKGEKLKPMNVKEFLPFFEQLLPQPIETGSQATRKIPEEMKTAFLKWLVAKTGLKDYDITDRLGQTFENLFNEIESEYGRVAAADIDPRFVHLFLLSSPK
ncbi:MAG: hypothetical protein JRF29_12885 [Deltaproteobacteria bacterium]|jgi:hypothetical protein|nr:hypothetical protein [Deltaproteobacteria bacterium]